MLGFRIGFGVILSYLEFGVMVKVRVSVRSGEEMSAISAHCDFNLFAQYKYTYLLTYLLMMLYRGKGVRCLGRGGA